MFVVPDGGHMPERGACISERGATWASPSWYIDVLVTER
jgi:hypothetical protein